MEPCDNRGMTTKELDATVFREGSAICREAEVVLRYEARILPVPLAGQAAYGYKDVGRHHPTIIRFLGWIEHGFEGEVRELSHGAMDDDVRRRQLDEGWAPPPIDLELEDGQSLSGCHLQAPISGFGPIAELDFQLLHPPLV